MTKFKYMEYAVTSPSNRNHFNTSKEVINFPFKKENRYKEVWRSMFLYTTSNPNSEDPMFGNFYIESDEEDFNTNKNMILDVVNYMELKYKIPTFMMDFFITNRSIWLSIPAKVFNCYGNKKLNLIYKSMAEEINQHLLSEGYKKGIDLSIYKWNGLIHSLGSYLHKSQRWVTKFSYNDLENSYTVDNLLNAKYDYFFTYDDIETMETATKWFNKHKMQVLNMKNKNKVISKVSVKRQCMKRLEEKGIIEENRNLHIYSYALHLKELGYSTTDAIDKIQNTFHIDYVQTRECLRTIKSAIEGDKNFNYKVVREILSPDLFEETDEETVLSEKDTFIVPRSFIQLLNKKRAHYETYKILIRTLYNKQIKDKSYTLSLKGEKYKNNIKKHFEVLKELGLITYTLDKEEIEAQLTFKSSEVYKSHIVIPNTFINSKSFTAMKKELKLFMELLRMGINKGKNKNTVFFNTKLETLVRNLGSTKTTLVKYFTLLRKGRLIIGKHLFIMKDKKEWKKRIKTLVKKIKEKRNKIKIETTTEQVKEMTSQQYNGFIKSLEIIKCIYSSFIERTNNSVLIGTFNL